MSKIAGGQREIDNMLKDIGFDGKIVRLEKAFRNERIQYSELKAHMLAWQHMPLRIDLSQPYIPFTKKVQRLPQSDAILQAYKKRTKNDDLTVTELTAADCAIILFRQISAADELVKQMGAHPNEAELLGFRQRVAGWTRPSIKTAYQTDAALVLKTWDSMPVLIDMALPYNPLIELIYNLPQGKDLLTGRRRPSTRQSILRLNKYIGGRVKQRKFLEEKYNSLVLDQFERHLDDLNTRQFVRKDFLDMAIRAWQNMESALEQKLTYLPLQDLVADLPQCEIILKDKGKTNQDLNVNDCIDILSEYKISPIEMGKIEGVSFGDKIRLWRRNANVMPLLSDLEIAIAYWRDAPADINMLLPYAPLNKVAKLPVDVSARDALKSIASLPSALAKLCRPYKGVISQIQWKRNIQSWSTNVKFVPQPAIDEILRAHSQLDAKQNHHLGL